METQIPSLSIATSAFHFIYHWKLGLPTHLAYGNYVGAKRRSFIQPFAISQLSLDSLYIAFVIAQFFILITI